MLSASTRYHKIRHVHTFARRSELSEAHDRQTSKGNSRQQAATVAEHTAAKTFVSESISKSISCHFMLS